MGEAIGSSLRVGEGLVAGTRYDVRCREQQRSASLLCQLHRQALNMTVYLTDQANSSGRCCAHDIIQAAGAMSST
eukprot:3724275-Amphidinium_carterae.2